MAIASWYIMRSHFHCFIKISSGNLPVHLKSDLFSSICSLGCLSVSSRDCRFARPAASVLQAPPKCAGKPHWGSPPCLLLGEATALVLVASCLWSLKSWESSCSRVLLSVHMQVHSCWFDVPWLPGYGAGLSMRHSQYFLDFTLPQSKCKH